MTSENYDVVVIGGGINGAGVAQAAAAIGHRVVLLEQNQNPGMETSSRSSKLVHGGLRYLESFDVSLVRESLQERELLLRLAPELVHLTRFNIPLYQHTRRNKLTLHAGLSLYAILAGLKKHHYYRQLKIKEWEQLEGLTQRHLRTVFQYQDAQTDDQALTLSVMESAIKLGALIHLNAHFINARIDSQGVEVVYQQREKTHVLKSRVMVNASGPWVSDVISQIDPPQRLIKPELVQGAHLVMQAPVHQAYYLEAPQDGRAVFLLPWKDRALLGTTERIYQGDPAKVKTTEEERNYLLEVYRHYFPLNDDRLLSEMAGCRVLPASRNNLYKRSRETVFELNGTHKPRVVSIIGGKLTVYRRTALKALHFLQSVLPDRKPLEDTAKLKLYPVDRLSQ
ncbi:MAG: FAD-dependent oxidoreductase [Gammaproteobacteria bacterium]|nr:FAD-dependent oxidoreductase [Gammaproteobacteria bacterium]